jgi:flavin-dependent dehydrogenase
MSEQGNVLVGPAVNNEVRRQVMKCYDIVIVGAGPAGLMAAKTAGENGLNVALVERKESVTAIQRSCQTMVAIEDEYYFGERMYLNEDQHMLVFPVNNFTVRYNGPHRDFYAWNVYTSDGEHCIRLGDYEKNRAGGRKTRLSAFYSKQALLEGLYQDVAAAGVQVFPGRNVIDHRRVGDTNQVVTAEGNIFRCVFTIAADGINSRLTRVLSLNKDREFYGTLQGAGYYMTGLDIPYPEAANSPMFYDKKTRCPVMLWVGLSPYGEGEFWVYSGGPTHPMINYMDLVDQSMSEGPFAKWFAHAKILRRHGHVANVLSPVTKPFKDNVLIVGDAGWTVEAECTGSIMSGRKAANAITEAFRENRLNQAGVQRYIDWWLENFPGSMDYREFITIMSGGLIGEDASTYLNKLVTEVLPCSLNPYNLFNNVNASIMKNMDRIQKERPDILMKMQHMAGLPQKVVMKDFIRYGFPNI